MNLVFYPDWRNGTRMGNFPFSRTHAFDHTGHVENRGGMREWLDGNSSVKMEQNVEKGVMGRNLIGVKYSDILPKSLLTVDYYLLLILCFCSHTGAVIFITEQCCS